MTSSRHVSVVIAAPPHRVVEVAGNPDRLPEWAQGLASGITRDGDDLVASSPMGDVRIRFAPPNDWGVLDHDVTLPDGTTVTNPLRVLAHPDGAEVVFTVRQLAMSDEQFEADCAAVRRDLDTLRTLVE